MLDLVICSLRDTVDQGDVLEEVYQIVGALGRSEVGTKCLSGSLKVRDNLGGFKLRRGDNIMVDRKEIVRVYVICIQLIRVRYCDDLS